MGWAKTNFPHVEKSGKRIRINVKGIFLFGVNESRRVDAPPMQAKVWAAAPTLFCAGGGYKVNSPPDSHIELVAFYEHNE